MTSSHENMADMTIEHMADLLGYEVFTGHTPAGNPGIGLKRNGRIAVKPRTETALRRLLSRGIRRMANKKTGGAK